MKINSVTVKNEIKKYYKWARISSYNTFIFSIEEVGTQKYKTNIAKINKDFSTTTEKQITTNSINDGIKIIRKFIKENKHKYTSLKNPKSYKVNGIITDPYNPNHLTVANYFRNLKLNLK